MPSLRMLIEIKYLESLLHLKLAVSFLISNCLSHAVRLPFLFTVVPLSVLRSMMSKVVRSSEQGKFNLLKDHNESVTCTAEIYL